MKAYSQDLRDRAIAMYNLGYTALKISKVLLIHYETSKAWIRKYRLTGKCTSIQHLNKGVKRKFTDKIVVLAYLKDHPNALALEMRDALVPNLPITTFRDALLWMNITYKKRDRIYSER